MRAHKQQVQWIHHGVVGLMFRGNVPLTALVCKGDVVSRLQHARAEMAQENKALLGGLMFTCTARNAASDAQGFASVFPRTHLAGMPCGGDIGPRFRTVGASSSSSNASTTKATQAGQAEMHGFTAVYGLFSVPVPPASRRSVSSVEEAFEVPSTTCDDRCDGRRGVHCNLPEQQRPVMRSVDGVGEESSEESDEDEAMSTMSTMSTMSDERARF